MLDIGRYDHGEITPTQPSPIEGEGHPPDGAIKRARHLRRDVTAAERAMWRILREGFPEHHFRKQVPIRHFIADFACHQAKLIIEVDGGQHSVEADAARSAVLAKEGYRVIRFWNDEVLNNPDGIWLAIDATLPNHHPTPTPPHQGEGV